MTRDEMKNELANIECHIRTFLPVEYLESIGANVQAPNHKRELHHRCMRIFDDLATRLSTPAPVAHDCESWRMEGIGCADCNPLAGPSVTVSTGSEIAVHLEEYVPPVAAPPADLVAIVKRVLAEYDRYDLRDEIHGLEPSLADALDALRAVPLPEVPDER